MSTLMCCCCVELVFFCSVQATSSFHRMFLVIWCRNASGAFASLALLSSFDFSVRFLECIQGSDKGLTASSQRLYSTFSPTDACYNIPFNLVGFSANHFTVLSVGCSVSVFAREACVRLFKMTELRNKHHLNDALWKRCACEIKQGKDVRFTCFVFVLFFCSERVPVCIPQSVLSTLPGVISVNRCWPWMFALGNRRDTRIHRVC